VLLPWLFIVDSELLAQLATAVGAHTIGWDAVGRCLYAFCPGSDGAAVYQERG
jgi:hypothetical protein